MERFKPFRTGKRHEINSPGFKPLWCGSHYDFMYWYL